MNRHLKILLLAIFATLPGAIFAGQYSNTLVCPTTDLWMNCTNGLWTAYVPYDGSYGGSWVQAKPQTACSSTPTPGSPTHKGGDGVTYHFTGHLQLTTTERFSSPPSGGSPCSINNATNQPVYVGLKCTYNVDGGVESPIENAATIQLMSNPYVTGHFSGGESGSCSQWQSGSGHDPSGFSNQYSCTSGESCGGVQL